MKKSIIICLLCFISILLISITMNKSYSAGIKIDITGEKGSRVLNYYDAVTGYKYSIDTLVEYYDYSEYFSINEDGMAYFYRGKEISEEEYNRGVASEKADRKALEYGSSGRRVKSTEEVINNIKDIFNNQRYGEFMFTFSKYDNIDWNSVKQFWDNNYGVPYPKKNYYSYSQKGNQEPDRWGLDISEVSLGELKINATSIRITKDELQVTDNFAEKLIAPVKNKSDYEKIAYVYKYIITKTNYFVDSGYVNDHIASTASAYDALIKRQSACVGFSIAFSYLMDKLNVESYIVDNISEVNPNNYFLSTHTYNIVKLDNKFYKIDTTGKNFLGSVSSSEISDNNLNLANTSYSRNDLPNIDFNKIEGYLNEAKNLKTTTTQTPILFPTKKKTKEFIIPNSKTTNKTSKNNVTTENTTATSIKYENGTTKVYIKTLPTTTVKGHTEEQQKKKKFNLNYILIPLLILVIIIYIVYKVLMNRRKSDINGQQSM